METFKVKTNNLKDTVDLTPKLNSIIQVRIFKMACATSFCLIPLPP